MYTVIKKVYNMYPRRRITFTPVLLLICFLTTVICETTQTPKFKAMPDDFLPEMEERWICEYPNRDVCKPKLKIICCEYCTCNFACNITEELCCDGSDSTTFKNDTMSFNYCHSAAFLTVDDAELTGENYMLISACKPSETNHTIIDLCVATSPMHNSEDFFEILPVTSESGVSFRNKYCALCNGEAEFTYWDAEIKCKNRQIDGQTIMEISEQVRHSDQKCNILFYNPRPDINVPTCGFVQSCYKTKNMSSVSCDPIRSIYSFTDDGFGNKQCFTCSEIVFTCNENKFEMTGFSVLLDFNSKDESSKNKINKVYSDSCGENEIYDYIMDTCLEVKCTSPAILSNFSCISMYKTINKMQYELLIKVLVQNPENVPIKCSTCVEKLISDISKIHSSIGFSMGLETIKCRRNFFMKVSKSESENIPAENGNVSFVLIRERFLILDKHDYTDFVSAVISSIPGEVNITILEKTVTLNFILENREYQQVSILDFKYLSDPDDGHILINVPLSYITNDRRCLGVSHWNNIHVFKICPHVIIDKQLFKLFHLDHYLCFSCVSRDRYVENGNYIKICFKDYMEFYGFHTDVVTDEVVVFFSLTCTILSVVSLLVVLFTYFIFPNLRTLPGLNNMALCASMLLAHLLYQFGRKQTQLGKGCIALGILTHFTWVLTIVWQTICCMHVFRVFVTQTDRTTSINSRFKLFSFYTIFSFVFSSVVVSSNIIVKMVSSDQTNIGYGGEFCYINDALMSVLTFALPLGLSVVTNIILIVIVSIKICRMPDLQKNVKNKRNNIMIFVKLSTLTGVSWILGFMYAWTNNKVLLYTFVILTSLQGVFIMFSFVCNKRVFHLYKSILFGKKKNKQSSRNSIKASVCTSDVSLSTIKPD